MTVPYYWRPHEDAILRPYVGKPCPWDEVLPLLPGRSEWGAQRRLNRLRSEAGTLWRIDTAPLMREMMGRRVRHADGRLA